MKTKYLYRFALIIALISFMIAGAAPAQSAAQKPTAQPGSSQESVRPIPIHGLVLNGQSGLRVQALNSNGELVAEVLTRSNGYFFFKPLPNLTYRLQILDVHGQPLALKPDARVIVTPNDSPMAEYILPLATTQTVYPQESPQRTLIGNSISGKVLRLSDYTTPIVGVTVRAYTTNTGSPSPVKSTTTATDGTYSISGLSAGTYYVGFFPKSGSGFSNQYYNRETDLTHADGISVSDSYGATYIDGYLSKSGGVSGKVIGADNSAPVSNVNISVNDQSTGNFKGSGITGSNGAYTVTDLDPGAYIVQFSPSSSGPYRDQYYNNKPTQDTADGIQVATAVVPNINASLALKPLGGISGKVTGADGNVAVVGVNVTLDDKVTGAAVDFTSTGLDGKYSITGLDPGAYIVDFTPPMDSKYTGQYYNNKPSSDKADAVQVASSVVPGINAVLALGGSISGKITAKDGVTPLEGVFVNAFIFRGCYWTSVGFAMTDASGTYKIQSLAAGKYLLAFDPGGAYLSEYYNHKMDQSTADQVTVTAGSTTTINTSLTKGGVIKGKVTSADTSGPLKDVYVEVFNTHGNYEVSTTTDDQGLYTTPGLPSGTHFVEFIPSQFGASSAYVPEFYNKKVTETTADGVVVTAPNITPNINAALAKGGAISGNVLAADTSKPLENVSVDIYDKDGNDLYYYVSTDAAGNYSIPGLRSGNYRVRFSTPTTGIAKDYSGQYYQNKSSLSEANPVTVTAPSLVPGINASLVKGGSISGMVFALDGKTPVYGAQVDSYDSSNQFVKSVRTNAMGAYLIPGLAAGSFRVHFSVYGQCTSYEDYYNKKGSLATADPVQVTPPNDTGNINGFLKVVVPPPVVHRLYLPNILH